MGCCHPAKTLEVETTEKVTKIQRSSKALVLTPGDFVSIKVEPITGDYVFEDVLGYGAFGEVRKAYHKISKSERAIKSIDISNCKEEDIQKLLKEVSILKLLDHPNIIRIFEVYRSLTKLYIVTEICTGGELFHRIKHMKKFSENQAAKYMLEIISAVMHCHQRGVVHRDLKPENLLFTSKNPDAKLKLIDFGTSALFDKTKKMKGIIGTYFYMAPEVISGNYDEKCDVWSLGVILYILLSGNLPFSGSTDEEIISKIQNAPVSFTRSTWNSVSEEAKTLIMKMLKKVPETRISIEDVFSSQWLKSRSRGNLPDVEFEVELLNKLGHFETESTLQHAVYSYIISQMMDSSYFIKLNEIFSQIDKNGDGMISREELVYAALKFDLKFDIDQIIQRCDTDGNGYINYSEFLTATVEASHAYSRERVRQVFEVFDKNKDGKLSLDEIRSALGGDANNFTVFKQIISEVDTNCDGYIDFDEFLNYVSKRK
ncbi:hypothetical protein SteCoe_13916 [Stentor coeruleus]|uniref:non-specific serine/threonine protein kinase n=1 Tax=Stentor coeruleus TaxID=5963 RepID=A0A1R2C7A1_9CILI|nr:hypothetical protein SteCoe_13916 [Stentor coeruleus]